MQVIQEQSENGEVVLKLQVEDERYQKHLASASRRIAQQVDIPGFRKGKAPPTIVQSFVGRERIISEAIESLVPEAVADAVQQEEITPFDTPRVDIEETEPAIVLKATVPLQPSIELGDYKAVRVEDEAEEITEENIDEYVERLRRMNSYLKAADRPAEIDDVVTMSLRATNGDEVMLEFQDREFFLRAESSFPFENLAESIVGLEAGQEKETELRIAEFDEEQGEYAPGRITNVHISISEVKEEILPPLDDSLADLYQKEGIDTIEKLRLDLRETLEQAAEDELTRRLETKVIDAISETSQFHISPIIIEREGRHLIDHEIRRQQAMTGQRKPTPVNIEDIPDETIKQAEEAAESRIKRSLVIQKLTESEDVQIPEQDIQDEIQRNNEAAESDDRKLEDNEETRESVRDFLRRQRSLRNAIEIARSAEAQ